MKVGIFHTAFLGDLANCGRLIKGLHLANHEVVLFSNRGGCQLFLHDERIHKKIVVQKKRGFEKFLQIWKIIRTLRAESLDCLLVPHRSFTSALVALFSGASQTVGFDGFLKSYFFSKTVSYPSDVHESKRVLALGKVLCFGDAVTAQLCEPENWMSSYRRPQHFFESFGFLEICPDNKYNSAKILSSYFVVSPGSVWATKRYPIENWVKVISLILKKFDHLTCVLAGGPEENEIVLKIKEALDFEAIGRRVLNGVAAIPLAELASVLGRAAFSISNDSGPLHVSCAVGCPTIGIYGPTSDQTGFGPIGKKSASVFYNQGATKKLSCQPCSKHGHKVCPIGHFRCMKDLAAEVIFEAVCKVLG